MINKNTSTLFVFILWLSLAIISYNHIYKINDILNLSIDNIGLLGWIALGSSLLINLKKDKLIIISIFFLLLSIGTILGPYLEIPSDPLEHLRRTYFFCNKFSYEIASNNFGLLHYSMSSIFLCNSEIENPQWILLKINLVHGLYFSFLGTSLVLLSINAGLKIKWCILNLIIMLLFFGTNRFSYFSYYTLAPSCTSMIIYWLWITNFYFKSGLKSFYLGSLLFIMILPILWTNHIQEFVFVNLVYCMWIIFNLHQIINRFKLSNKFFINIIFVIGLFLILFESVENSSFKSFITSFFLNNYNNNEFIYENVYKFGNLGGFRVIDTLGLLGFFPLFLIFIIFGYKYTDINFNLSLRSYFLSIIPFIVFFTPLLSYIWLKNVNYYLVYRIMYSSLFGLTISIFLQGFENVVFKYLEFFGNYFKVFIIGRIIFLRKLFYFSVLFIFIALSTFRSPPIYGKLDFLMLDNKPWWPEWEKIIDESFNDKRVILTDPITALVLHFVFNQQTTTKNRFLSNVYKINLKYIEKLNKDNKYNCIINFVDIDDSWVPIDTGHWDINLSHTSNHYTSNSLNLDEINTNDFKMNNCKVFK